MTPSEKNIQNRIKEYFDIKVNMDLLTKRVNDDIAIDKHKQSSPKFIVETLYDKNKNVCST